MSNTVKLKNYSNVFEEYAAVAAITPGHLLELTSANKVQVHSTEAGIGGPPMFALEDELQGNDIDTAYAADDVVQVWIPGKGDIVNAILKDEETVVIGDELISAGDGTLKKYDAGSAMEAVSIVGIALAALDLSSSSAATVAATRIAVRIV